MQILLLITSVFVFSFLEPFFYYAFGISVILILSYSLFSRKIKMFQMILMVVVTLILDSTLKFPLGSHLLSVSIALGVWYVFEKFIPANIPFFEIIKLFISFLVSLTLLKFLQEYAFSPLYFSSSVMPSFVSAILATFLNIISSQFGSNNSLNKLKIK